MAEAAINAASKMPHSQKQTDLLDETKTVAESATELLYAVKDAGGNPKVTQIFFHYSGFLQFNSIYFHYLQDFSQVRNITKVEGNYKILMSTLKKDCERQPEEPKLSSWLSQC